MQGVEIYTDVDGEELIIGRQGPGAAFLRTPPGGVAVEGTDMAGVFRAMCGAAGLSPDVIRGIAAAVEALAEAPRA